MGGKRGKIGRRGREEETMEEKGEERGRREGGGEGGRRELIN